MHLLQCEKERLNLPIKSGMKSMNYIIAIATCHYTPPSKAILPLSTVTVSLHGSLSHFYHMNFSSLAVISTHFLDAIIKLVNRKLV